jgi:hypothetical protein
VENILRFEHDSPGAKIVRLEENYSSAEAILAAASALIAHNEGRLGKTLRSGLRDPSGERVTVAGLWDSGEEAPKSWCSCTVLVPSAVQLGQSSPVSGSMTDAAKKYRHRLAPAGSR